MSVTETQAWDEVIRLVVEAVCREVGTIDSLPDHTLSIPLEVSNRHCHLTRETFEALFGTGQQLTPIRWLSQPSEFACKENVTVISSSMRVLEGVRIVGPYRKYDQVELSLTDGFHLGLDLPTRLTGDLEDSPPITLAGPQRAITLKEGAIRAARHVHMSSSDAERFRLRDGEKIDIEVFGPNELVFRQVVVRVTSQGKLACHINTDEANAAGIRGTGYGRIV